MHSWYIQEQLFKGEMVIMAITISVKDNELTLLKDENTSLNKRVDIITEENSELRDQVSDLKEQIENLKIL